jgi:PAS domain S-box-containing protein
MDQDTKQIEKALIDSENKYRALFSEMLNGCALHEIICDEGGKPVNYRFLEVNPAFETITGFMAKDILGKTILDLAPDIDPFFIETYGKVALTGEPASFDFYNNNSGRHYVITAYQPESGQFACVFRVTSSKPGHLLLTRFQKGKPAQPLKTGK